MNPTYSRLAELQTEEPMIARDIVLRGEASPIDDAAHVRYRFARSLLKNAETRTFWIIRRFDREQASEALTLLNEAAETVTPESPLYSAVQFHIGKAYLALEDPDRARAALRTASGGFGPYAHAARQLEADIGPDR